MWSVDTGYSMTTSPAVLSYSLHILIILAYQIQRLYATFDSKYVGLAQMLVKPHGTQLLGQTEISIYYMLYISGVTGDTNCYTITAVASTLTEFVPEGRTVNIDLTYAIFRPYTI